MVPVPLSSTWDKYRLDSSSCEGVEQVTADRERTQLLCLQCWHCVRVCRLILSLHTRVTCLACLFLMH